MLLVISVIMKWIFRGMYIHCLFVLQEQFIFVFCVTQRVTVWLFNSIYIYIIWKRVASWFYRIINTSFCERVCDLFAVRWLLGYLVTWLYTCRNHIFLLPACSPRDKLYTNSKLAVFTQQILPTRKIYCASLLLCLVYENLSSWITNLLLQNMIEIAYKLPKH